MKVKGKRKTEKEEKGMNTTHNMLYSGTAQNSRTTQVSKRERERERGEETTIHSDEKTWDANI